MLIFLFILNLAYADWVFPNPPSSGIGDMGSFYFTEDNHWSLHIMNNDFVGNTDKLMTGSTNLYYYQKLEDRENADKVKIPRGIEFSINRRLLTPVFQTKFTTDKLKTPFGVYCDWIETRLAYGEIINNWKIEFSLSIDFFGNYDGQKIQSRLHNIIGTRDDMLDFANPEKGTYGAGSLGLGYFFTSDLLLMGYFQKNEIIQDWELRASYKYEIGKWSLGLQGNLVSQDYSDFYNETTSTRYGWATSLKYSWWQASFGFVSKYLKNDDFGQFYLDPVIINFMF